MDKQDRHNLFSELIATHHSQLYAYIFAIVRNREDASDVFQSVCLVLWRKFEMFEPGSSFFAWARQTAKLTVRSFLRQRTRHSTHVSEELLDALAETAFEAQNDDVEFYRDVLRRCKAKLSVADNELIELRYAEDLGSREIADRLQRPQQGVCHSLKRIRRALLDCIQIEFGRQNSSTGDLS